MTCFEREIVSSNDRCNPEEDGKSFRPFLLIAPIKRIDWTLFGDGSKFNQSPAGASAASR